MLFLPESPRWLAKMDRNEEARQVIGRLYENEFIEQKMNELETEAEKLNIETHLPEKERLRSLFSTYLRCLVIGCGV